MGLVEGVRSLRGWLIYVAVMACFLIVLHFVSFVSIFRVIDPESDIRVVAIAGLWMVLHASAAIYAFCAGWQFLSRDPRAPTTCIRALALSCGLQMIDVVLIEMLVNGVALWNVLRLLDEAVLLVVGIAYLKRSKRVQERFGTVG